MRQISNGSYSAVWLVKERGTEGPLLVAKTVQDTTVEGSPETNVLRSLQDCGQVVRLMDAFHSHLQTIIITEYLPGRITTYNGLVLSNNGQQCIFFSMSPI